MSVSDVEGGEDAYSEGVVTRARPDSICLAVVIAVSGSQPYTSSRKIIPYILSCRAGLEGRADGSVNCAVLIVVVVQLQVTLPLY